MTLVPSEEAGSQPGCGGHLQINADHLGHCGDHTLINQITLVPAGTTTGPGSARGSSGAPAGEGHALTSVI